MSKCSNCQTEIDSGLPGQLCERCQNKVLSQDTYTESDLRFVGILAGVLTGALASMPGAFLGYCIGWFMNDQTRGCTIGLTAFVLAGLVAGYRIGPGIVLRMEAAKQHH